MAFDASVISSIGDSGPDVAGAQAKGLTLADMYDQRQLTGMKVNEAKQSQADMTYAKQILAGKDLSKLEDQNAAVAAITKRSPQLGMELMKSFQAGQKGKTEEDLAQIQLFDAKNNIIGGALYPLKAKHDDLISRGMNEKQVAQAMEQDSFATLKQLSQATLPNGQPLLNDTDRQYILQNFKNGYNAQAVDQLVATSEKAKAAIAQKYAQKRDDRADKASERADNNADRADRRLADMERRQATSDKLQDEGKLEPDDAKFMADQYIAGDKSVLTGLGRGRQGPGNIILVRRAIREAATAKGLKPEDVAARLAEYNGYVSEQRSLGTQQANVEMASSEAEQMIQNARQASADVPRGSFLPWTKIAQMGDKQLNDKGLASLKAATVAVINTWARAINPKGVATVADKEHGYELLNAAQDQGAYEAVLDRFEQETQASLAAPASAKARLHDAFLASQSSTAGGSGTGRAPPLAGTTPPAAGTPTATPGRGAPAGGGPAKITPPPPPGFVIQNQD